MGLAPLSAFSKKLLGIVALSGLMAVFFIPPFQSPDETDHFKRVVQIGGARVAVANAEGRSSGAYLDLSVGRVIAPFLHLPHERAARVGVDHFMRAFREGELARSPEFVEFPGSVSYAPWAYPGQVLGYLAGALLSDNMLVRFYASRLGAWALSMFLLVLALRIWPVERWPRLSLILALAPLALFQFGALSPDGFLISAVLFVGCVCAALRNGTSDSRLLAWVVLPLFVAIGSKPPVALLLALPLCVAFSASVSRRDRSLLLIGVAAALGATLLWFSYALPRIENLRQEGVSTLAQQMKKAAVQADPLRYVGFGLKVFIERIWGYFSSLYGEMGWLDAPAPKFFIAVGRVLFLWAVFVSLVPRAVRRFRESNSWKTRVVDFVPLLVGIGYVAGVMIALYLTWARPGVEHMGAGVQGRYFFPLLGLPLFTLWRDRGVTLSWKLFFWVAAVNGPVALALTLWRRYYVGA